MELSKQAKNSLMLYKGASISSVVTALGMQRKVAEELRNYFGVSTNEEVARKVV